MFKKYNHPNIDGYTDVDWQEVAQIESQYPNNLLLWKVIQLLGEVKNKRLLHYQVLKQSLEAQQRDYVNFFG